MSGYSYYYYYYYYYSTIDDNEKNHKVFLGSSYFLLYFTVDCFVLFNFITDEIFR